MGWVCESPIQMFSYGIDINLGTVDNKAIMWPHSYWQLDPENCNTIFTVSNRCKTADRRLFLPFRVAKMFLEEWQGI